jgi:hypothetical protein
MLRDASPKAGKMKFLVAYAADFRKPSEYFISGFVTALCHRPFRRFMSGLYTGIGVQGEINKINPYARTTRRRRQMNDFWKLDNLGIPSDAARQIREQHEKELAAERDARRQTPARGVRGEAPKSTDYLRGLSSLRA